MKRFPFFENPVLRAPYPLWRGRFVLVLLALAFLALILRAVYLQGITTQFLQKRGERVYESTLTLHASRGKILDRNGVVLAASVPARSVAIRPKEIKEASPKKLQQLAELLSMSGDELHKKVTEDKPFVYLKRQVPLDIAQKITDLRIPGLIQQPDNRRLYPESEVMANVVGFNNLEDQGQEGVEYAFNEQLSGQAGSRRVVRDRLGRHIDGVGAVDFPVDGRDLQLSLDTRIQYQVYRALQEAMVVNKAKGAATVVIDIKTGEILALGNMPTYDPNKRE